MQECLFLLPLTSPFFSHSPRLSSLTYLAFPPSLKSPLISQSLRLSSLTHLAFLLSLTSPLFSHSPRHCSLTLLLFLLTTSTQPHPHIFHILTTTFTPPHSHNHIHTTTFSKPHSHYTLTQPHSHNTSDKQIGGEKNQWRERNCGKLLPIGPVTKKLASLRRKRPSCGSKIYPNGHTQK